ncbi:hypothetical protein H9Q70_001731 [Fusarium xylarioides]|nr:hypothetical protein H9Q70_001731 [Fusarium xylarioides]KAG5784676.1 hypothetical protein H9Q73_001658 [Fusarium xylarioides]KAG5813686.1 hypothetical protein H9Q71_003638 [Fusarium xylarioides]KAG5823438.1 hypothetical protein H9Q74_006456 [Fusarium xylarioides]
MCPYALGRQSLRDSGQINGMFDRTVDKAVNLIDSEMTAVKEQTEDLVTDFKVIVAGVGQGPMSFKRQARYLVLHPGQTIYMPLGTIHHVFRKQSDPTLITDYKILVRRYSLGLTSSKCIEPKAASSIDMGSLRTRPAECTSDSQALAWNALRGQCLASSIDIPDLMYTY